MVNPAQTLQALERSSERFRELIEAVPAVIYEAGPGLDATWHYVSPQLETLIGDTPEQWLADPTLYTRRLHPADRDAVFHAEVHEFEIATDERATCVMEYRMIHRDGREVWVRDEARLVDVGGAAPFWRGVFVDITMERAARHALAETYQRLSAVSDSRTEGHGAPASDVFRVTCAACRAVSPAVAASPCPACGSDRVSAESMDDLAARLAEARSDVDDLLDGIQRHLEMVGISLHGATATTGPRVVTRLPADPLTAA